MPILEKEYVSCFAFITDHFSDEEPADVLIGYWSGLIAHVEVGTNNLLGLFNYDENNESILRQSQVI